MALDPYSLCPCGSGKKLKFCCFDLLHEMEKIQQMLEGDQPAACLTYIKTLKGKHPHRASLLGLEARLEMQLERFDDARRTVDEFLAEHPDNPAALTEQAMLLAQTEGGKAAVPALQKVLDHIGREMPLRTYETLGAVGQALLIEGHILAARAHLSLQADIAKGRDKQLNALLTRIYGAQEIPIILKEDWPPAPAPADAPWSGEFNETLQWIADGRWQAAAERLEALVETSGDAPPVWRVLGLARSWLADAAGAAAALHKYAALDAPRDEAVELEALAQFLDTMTPAETEKDTVEAVRSLYPIQDIDALNAALEGDDRAPRISPESYFARLEEEEAVPPPRAAFALLDRPQLKTGAEGELTIDAIPEIIGHVYCFGRETDREARAELFTQGAEQLEAARASLAQIAGDALGAMSGENVVARLPRISHLLAWHWLLPRDTPRERRQALNRQMRRRTLFETWTAAPHPALEGKSPAEAAGDPNMQIKVLAAILLLEFAVRPLPEELDFNELRGQLKLPEAGPVDLDALENRDHIPLSLLPRLEVEKLTDDELAHEYTRATWLQFTPAAVKLAREVVRRDGVEDKIDKAAALGELADLASEYEEAKAYLDQAREISKARGESCGKWDLAELELQFEWGHGDEAGKLFEHIRSAHGNEPEVTQQLIELLMDLGLLRPDGTPAVAPPAEAQGVAPAEEAGKIWTPGGEAPGGEKKIWLPD